MVAVRQEDQEGLVMEQLIVGALLFVPSLVLLPTTLIWYLSLSLVILGLSQGPRWVLSNIQWAVWLNLPMILAWRFMIPKAFPSGINPDNGAIGIEYWNCNERYIRITHPLCSH